MCDINDYSFMCWTSDISHFLWNSYRYFLAWGTKEEIKKCLNELKGEPGKWVRDGDRQYLIKELEEKLAKFDK